jgi:hypothetical protein
MVSKLGVQFGWQASVDSPDDCKRPLDSLLKLGIEGEWNRWMELLRNAIATYRRKE